MTIASLARALRKRWIWTAVGVGLALAAAALATLLATPLYEAQTRVFVSTQGGGTSADLLQGSNFTQQRVESYADVVTSPRVLEPVVQQLGLRASARQLASQITAEVPAGTVLIRVSVRDESPEQAALVADAVAESFTRVITDLETAEGSPASPVRVSIIESASAPAEPVSPRANLNLLLGLVLGLVCGAAAAVLRDTLDRSVRGESDVTQVTASTVLGGIGFDPEADKRPLVVHVDPQSPRAEAFRQIRTNLQFVDVANHPRSIVVTSTLPGEGKSTTTANLAITMAEAGSRVALIEGDLRRPKVAEYLGIEGAVGLTTVLIGKGDLDDVIQPWGNGNLHVLPAGQIPPNPSELLGSRTMDDLLRKLEASYDAVIIDAPPLLPVTDAAVLSKLADGTVLVVGSGKIDRPQLGKALEHLRTVDARLLGVIMNLLPIKGPDAYTYYGYAHEYGSLTQGPRAEARRKR